jgi:Flp pilus assembly CpaE family ATPase
MDDVARVILAIGSQEVAEEVLHLLDRSGRARVVATAADDRQLAEAVRQLEPDAVVAEPAIAAAGVGSAALLALATRESIASLRAAIGAGAQGFYVWPQERQALLGQVLALAAARRVPDRRATVVAVHAARGGAGCTFVATHLAQALARRDVSCLLVECDPTFADLTQVLGYADQEVPTIADLVPVGDELTVEHLDGIRVHHDAGFDVVLGSEASLTDAVEDGLLRAVVGLAGASADVVVAHVPRHLSVFTRWCVEQADRIIEVVSLDVLSFRAAARAIEILSPLGLDDRFAFVVNRAARSEITTGDVRRVFEREALAVVPFDGAVGRLQDHGRLAPPRGRIGRAFDRLAGTIVETSAEAVEVAS